MENTVGRRDGNARKEKSASSARGAHACITERLGNARREFEHWFAREKIIEAASIGKIHFHTEIEMHACIFPWASFLGPQHERSASVGRGACTVRGHGQCEVRVASCMVRSPAVCVVLTRASYVAPKCSNSRRCIARCVCACVRACVRRCACTARDACTRRARAAALHCARISHARTRSHHIVRVRNQTCR